MKPRPACAVESCPSLATARRVVCCIHADTRAFVVVDRIWAPSLQEATPGGRPDAPEEMLCLRCATDRIRNGQASALRAVDDADIDERNRTALTAAERAACGRCGRFIAGSPARRRRRRRFEHVQSALWLTPPPFGGDAVMNAARLDSSPRLRRVLDFLWDMKEHTTRDIVAGAHVCAVNSCVAELRANGFDVSCRQEVVGGQRCWIYRLASREPSSGLCGGEPAAGSAGHPLPARPASPSGSLMAAGGSTGGGA